MKKTILLIILGLCTFYSCKKKNEKAEQTITIPKTEAIYASEKANKHLNFDKEFNEYEFLGVKEAQKFSASEIDFVVKENDFEYNKTADFDYFTIKTFDIGDTNFKVILYATFGENDIKVANIQLNSYRSGVQVDALLLDCRFEFETEYYRNFVIKNDNSIEIQKIAVDKLKYNAKGDIIGKREVNDTLIDAVTYKINPLGNFLKI